MECRKFRKDGAFTGGFNSRMETGTSFRRDIYNQAFFDFVPVPILAGRHVQVLVKDGKTFACITKSP